MAYNLVQRVIEHSKARLASRLVAIAIASIDRDEGKGAYPSIETIAALARLSARAVRYAIEELVELGELVVEAGAGPMGTNVYRLTIPVEHSRIPAQNDARTTANFAPLQTLHSCTDCTPANPAPCKLCTEGLQTLQKPPANFAANTVNETVIEPVSLSREVPKGDALTAKPPGKTAPSEEGYRFADWFRGTLPEDFRLVGTWRDDWAREYDDLIRLDGATKETIFLACKWAREDAFWSQNFRSPAKLRKRDEQKIKYLDIFLELARKANKGRNGRRQTVPSMVQTGQLTEDNAL